MTNNKQDKQQRRTVEAKNQMIGITIFFSDIRQQIIYPYVKPPN